MSKPLHDGAVSAASISAPALRIEFPVLLAIVSAFWTYATLSAVLFAYGVNAGVGLEEGKSPFAPWPPRVAQYALLFPVLLGCYAWSLRLGWQPLARRIPQQLALAVGFALLARPALIMTTQVLGVDVQHMVSSEEGHFSMALLIGLATFTDFLVRYGFGLALVTGVAYYKRYKDAELRSAALERQWHAARLATLRMQLSPHTLFNLLHTIRGQIAWDPGVAQSMVVQLADLLRRLLNAGERDFSRLTDEIEFVRLYLELQRQRFSDRLTLALPDAASLPSVWLPSLILQPLVENAVVHGLAGHNGPVHVELTIALDRDELRLTVANAIGPDACTNPEGVGLTNVRQRLDVQFGARGRLDAGIAGDGRWVSEIRLPALRDLP
jgi:hypothetical protein